MKLCVIGAGAAGLCAVKNGIDFGCEVTAFEQSNGVGGTWNYTDEVGKDKNGLDIHSSMYQGLLTNAPKEVMGYPTEPFPDGERSYIPAEDVLNYYISYADKFELRRHIKFEHYVVRVQPIQDESWEVIVQDMSTKVYSTHNFHAVLVCNGHFSAPKAEKFLGQELFKGKQIHSHDYKTCEHFRGENILIIGAGASGFDFTIDLSKVARKITWSHHITSDHPILKPPRTDYMSNVQQKPDVRQITSSGAVFVDGTSEDFTAIIYCTGYKYSFPFLSADCGIKSDKNYVRPLYKQCVNINLPTMGIIGLPSITCYNQLFDLQIRFFLTFMTGRKKIPSYEEMLEDRKNDLEMRKKLGMTKKKSHLFGPALEEAYFVDLAATAEIEPIKQCISDLYALTLKNLINDFQNFRKENYKIIDDETFIILNKSE